MKYLITGGCGFLGSNLARAVLAKSEELVVFDNLGRHGSARNLEWLRSQGKLGFVHGDIRSPGDIERVVQDFKPDFVFHLAGQVAMTTSLANPRLDFETNALGSFNVLDAVRRHAPEAVVLYSSTNKVYGDLEQVAYRETEKRYVDPERPEGFDENTPFAPESPYGVSKGSADLLMRDFHRMFGTRTVVFRHSSMYGGRQFATFDQGWVGWFCQKALEASRGGQEPFTISGNGKQVRDVLHADDMIELYFLAASLAARQAPGVTGQAFNIGGGMPYSLSLLELFELLEKELNCRLTYQQLAPRQSDQKIFVADLAKANRLLGWQPRVSPETGIRSMLGWLKEQDRAD